MYIVDVMMPSKEDFIWMILQTSRHFLIPCHAIGSSSFVTISKHQFSSTFWFANDERFIKIDSYNHLLELIYTLRLHAAEAHSKSLFSFCFKLWIRFWFYCKCFVVLCAILSIDRTCYCCRSPFLVSKEHVENWDNETNKSLFSNSFHWFDLHKVEVLGNFSHEVSFVKECHCFWDHNWNILLKDCNCNRFN